MPVRTVPNFDGAPGVVAAIAELEASGAVNIRVVAIGDQNVITYDMPKQGRPAKTETRG